MCHLPQNTLRRLVVLVSVGLLSFALFAACGEGEGEGENQNGGGEYADLDDAEMVMQVITDAYCEAAWDCYEDTREAADMAAFFYGRFHSVEDCKENADPLFGEAVVMEIEASSEGGRISIDRSAAGACRNAAYDAICSGDTGAEAMGACEDLLVGTQQEGDTCIDASECADDLQCDRGEETCYGTCDEPEASDDDCGGEQCGDNEYCDYDWEEETESCEPFGEQGDACEGGFQCEYDLDCIDGFCEPIEIVGEGEDCGWYRAPYCEPGLGCDGEPFSESGTCVEIGGEGDECHSDEACHAAYFCDIDDLEEPGECASPKPNGESCQSGSHCQSGNCEFEDQQDEEGTCTGAEDAMCVHPDDE